MIHSTAVLSIRGNLLLSAVAGPWGAPEFVLGSVLHVLLASVHLPDEEKNGGKSTVSVLILWGLGFEGLFLRKGKSVYKREKEEKGSEVDFKM